MKRLLLLFPVLLALTLTACADAPSGPSDTTLTPTAPSFAVTQNWFDMNSTIFNSCGPTPEEVLVQGRIHQVVKQHGDKLEFRTNYDALKGVGQTTGNTYVSQISAHEIQVPFTSLPFSLTSDWRQRIISKGSADNFFIGFHMIWTFPPFVVTEFTITSDCQG